MNTETLKAIGGQEWQGRRVYFNDILERFGLQVSRYTSGNVRSATLRGETISNTEARDIEHNLRSAKVWFNVQTDQFEGQDIKPKALARIVESIEADAAKYETTNA